MTDEIALSGGRVTAGIVRRGDCVLRPTRANSPFVHAVFRHLETKGIAGAPRFHGLDERGREILSYIEGEVPADLGRFEDDQLTAAARLIRRLHDGLCDVPGCAADQIVCHGDLSPCNFVFRAGQPVAVIDWDAAACGNRRDDLAYALWMWLDLGNPDYRADEQRARAARMIAAYGLAELDGDGAASGMNRRIARQMLRVSDSVFASPQQTEATRAWALSCLSWLQQHPLSL